MPRPELWLVRHGETEWSASGRHTSRTDVALTGNGREAARALAPLLADQPFDLVLTSPMQRARETCELAGLGSRAEVTSDLCEWGYGDYEGVTTDTIRQTDPQWTVFDGVTPGGETPDEVGARLDAVVARVREVAGPAVAFGHGHALRVLAARWIDLPARAAAHLVLDTATIGVLGWERETPAIRRWNLTA